MQRLTPLPPTEKNKIRFIHLNHTNPALVRDGEARKAMAKAGFQVATAGEQMKL